jgi:RNA polymerase sigma-70 factor (ECF subfamily)
VLFLANPDSELSPEDKANVARIRGGEPGDRIVFDEIARRYIPSMIRLAAAINPVEGAHEDVVQTVLCRLWERRSEFNPRKSIAAYLMAAVRSHALDARRQDKSRDQLLDNTAEHFAHDESLHLFPPPGGALEVDDRTLAMRRAFYGLNERQRTVLHLRYGQQMSYAECASVMGVTSKAVERLLAKAIAALRAKIGLSGEDGDPDAE